MKSLNDLRSFLAEQLERVASGELTPAHANASANLAGKVLSTVKMELDYCKQAGSTPVIPFLGIGADSPRVIEHKNVDAETGEVLS